MIFRKSDTTGPVINKITNTPIKNQPGTQQTNNIPGNDPSANNPTKVDVPDLYQANAVVQKLLNEAKQAEAAEQNYTLSLIHI